MTDPRDHKLANILVVDDEEMNLTLLEEIFSMEGFPNVTLIDDPVTALSVFEKEPFDIILLDLKMPRMDGFEFLKQIKDKAQNPPPVLVLTASADKETEARVLSANAHGVISKPFDHDNVLKTIKKLVDQHWQVA